ncbi:MAG: O-antigen ligase family protein [Rhodospirillaceae bacterium]|nr:O-antigen ligase family protein [Rhodospirillaceae bacterium]
MNAPPNTFANLFAVLVGIALPMVVVGRAVLGISLILALICLIFANTRGSRWQDFTTSVKTTLFGLLIVTFFAWLPNLFNSVEPLRSLEGAARSLLFVVAAIFIWSGLAHEPQLAVRCRRAMLIAMAGALIITLAAILIHPGFFWIFHLRGWLSTELISDLKPFAALFPLLVPFLIFCVYIESRHWRMLALFGSVAAIVALYLIYNRAAMAGFMGAGLTVVTAMVYRFSLRRALPYALALIVIVAGIVVWLKLTRYVPDHAGEYPLPLWLLDFERQAIWGFVFNVFTEHPFIGIGINTVNFIPGADTLIPATNDTPIIPSHPHNWAIEILAETGLIGFVPFFLAVIYGFYCLCRLYRRSGSPVILAAIAAYGGYWASGLFNFSYWSAWWQVSYLVITAICISTANEKNSAVTE